MRKHSSFYVYLFIVIVGMWLLMTVLGNPRSTDDYSINDFYKDVQDETVEAIYIDQDVHIPTGTITVAFKDGTADMFYVTDVSEIEAYALANDVQVVTDEVTSIGEILTSLLPYICLVIMMIFMFMIFMRSAGAGGGGANQKLMDFGKSRAQKKKAGEVGKTFKDVAGLKEEKEELGEIVDFLKNPAKYTKLGARIPKGILMEGPPGTGKTLIAKAIAGEANVPFFSISGSDFVEMFVGVGASRVRDLFEDAKANAPCIIFIDEIDAVARRRGTGMGGGHDEREQTLNQILVEMDGFNENVGIIVMAATNRVDILDPAILRPGRFDRKVVIGRPDVDGREEILKVHAKNKPLAEDVNLDQVARSTYGFTGADLENLLNESAIHAASENRSFINMEDIRKSFIKVGVGTEKKSRVVTEKDRKITAYHEAGHAILFHVLPDVGPVYTVSIIPTGQGAGGYTMPLPERNEMYMTKNMMYQEIMVTLGGRIAESLIFDDITTGASSDIKQVTRYARDMVTKYGFSEEIGMVNYDTEDNEVFIGRDLAHQRSFSENTQAKIDEVVTKIVDRCYKDAKKILEENMDKLEACAQLLLQKERISKEEFEALWDESPKAEDAVVVESIDLD